MPLNLDTVKYCSYCGGSLELVFQAEDAMERLTCSQCHSIVYGSPQILVGCILTWEDKVLWIRRGNEPRKGFWAVPTGFMESNESPEEAVARELYEETRATIDPNSLVLYMVGSLPDISEVYLAYRGKLSSPYFETTDEATEIALFNKNDVPWGDTAYPDVMDLMRTFYSEHEVGDYGVYNTIYRDGVHAMKRIDSSSAKP